MRDDPVYDRLTHGLGKPGWLAGVWDFFRGLLVDICTPIPLDVFVKKATP